MLAKDAAKSSVRPHCHETMGWVSCPAPSTGAPSAPHVVTASAPIWASPRLAVASRDASPMRSMIRSRSQTNQLGRPDSSGSGPLARVADPTIRPALSTALTVMFVEPQSITRARMSGIAVASPSWVVSQRCFAFAMPRPYRMREGEGRTRTNGVADARDMTASAAGRWRDGLGRG